MLKPSAVLIALKICSMPPHLRASAFHGWAKMRGLKTARACDFGAAERFVVVRATRSAPDSAWSAIWRPAEAGESGCGSSSVFAASALAERSST